MCHCVRVQNHCTQCVLCEGGTSCWVCEGEILWVSCTTTVLQEWDNNDGCVL